MGDFKTERNKDGCGWRRVKRIGNDNFEKFSQFFSKYTNDDVAVQECKKIPILCFTVQVTSKGV